VRPLRGGSLLLLSDHPRKYRYTAPYGSLSPFSPIHLPNPTHGVLEPYRANRRSIGGAIHAGVSCPKERVSPLELLTRRGASQAEIAQRLGITAEEVAKFRRQLRHLNWVVVGVAYELVRFDRRTQLQGAVRAAGPGGGRPKAGAPWRRC
jgi:hypothetical protein